MKYFVGADNLGADHSGGVASQMAFLNLVIGSGHDSDDFNFVMFPFKFRKKAQ